MRNEQRNKSDWFFCMGMIDTYDYLRGCHPLYPDDENSTEWWMDRAIAIVETVIANRTPMNIT